jgi:conjugal transfer pilin signal peptidase TrbI
MLLNYCRKLYLKFLFNKSLQRNLLLYVVFLGALYGFGISFALNTSDSLPQKLFIIKLRPKKIAKGDYVIFEQEVLGRKQWLIKRVLGTENDQINCQEKGVWVNQLYIGDAKSHSKEGQPLLMAKPAVIQAGYLFTAGSHPDSFDSRYQAVGLIHQDRIIARAYPLF